LTNQALRAYIQSEWKPAIVETLRRVIREELRANAEAVWRRKEDLA
jgi:hypothetical protein